MAKRILASYPDYGKAPPEYVVGFAETLSHMTDEEIGWINDPREGLVTRCKYLPTPADVFDLIRERKAKAEQFIPPHTTYKRLAEETGPWDQTPAERKAQVVRELLGYNPGPTSTVPVVRTFSEPTAEDLANLKLKTASAPPTQQLIDLLKGEGWPFIPEQRA